jgi:hypothetical protein
MAKGKSNNAREKVMAKGRGCNHQGENNKNDKGERIMVRMFELKREEFEVALATNGNLQPKKPNTMGKEETTKKTLEPLNIFVSHLTHT